MLGNIKLLHGFLYVVQLTHRVCICRIACENSLAVFCSVCVELIGKRLFVFKIVIGIFVYQYNGIIASESLGNCLVARFRIGEKIAVARLQNAAYDNERWQKRYRGYRRDDDAFHQDYSYVKTDAE